MSIGYTGNARNVRTIVWIVCGPGRPNGLCFDHGNRYGRAGELDPDRAVLRRSWRGSTRGTRARLPTELSRVGEADHRTSQRWPSCDRLRSARVRCLEPAHDRLRLSYSCE